MRLSRNPAQPVAKCNANASLSLTCRNPTKTLFNKWDSVIEDGRPKQYSPWPGIEIR